VADTATSGTVGGIDRASFSFWQNQSFDATSDGGGATTAANVQSYMQQLWLLCCRGPDKPDLIVGDSVYYQFFWESLTDIQRINRVDRGVAGFESLAFNTADVIFEDAAVPASHFYFLNTEYIHWRPHASRNMVPLENKMSVNQDATVVPMVFAGNLTMSNADVQGVMKE
jgi:hypothetical protein